jgi:hypothetical protein
MFDQLAGIVGVSGGSLLVAITRLELDGLVGRGPGGRIFRVR